MPKLLFRGSVLTFDKDFLKILNIVFFNFLRKGKDKIKRLDWLVIIVMADLKCPIWNLQLKLKESCALKSLLKITTVHGS